MTSANKCNCRLRWWWLLKQQISNNMSCSRIEFVPSLAALEAIRCQLINLWKFVWPRKHWVINCQLLIRVQLVRVVVVSFVRRLDSWCGIALSLITFFSCFCCSMNYSFASKLNARDVWMELKGNFVCFQW